MLSTRDHAHTPLKDGKAHTTLIPLVPQNCGTRVIFCAVGKPRQVSTLKFPRSIQAKLLGMVGVEKLKSQLVANRIGFQGGYLS